jgi:hypothetical protein
VIAWLVQKLILDAFVQVEDWDLALAEYEVAVETLYGEAA